MHFIQASEANIRLAWYERI